MHCTVRWDPASLARVFTGIIKITASFRVRLGYGYNFGQVTLVERAETAHARGVISPDLFFPAKLTHSMVFKCPRCVQTVHELEDICTHCGFALAVPDGMMGADPVLLERVTDAARVLKPGEIPRILAGLDAFETRFPQLFAVVYFGALPAQTNLRQFGFWLLNRAAVNSADFSRPNENGILIVVDTSGRTVAVVAGYLVERYLEESAVMTALQESRSAFGRSDWPAAVESIIAHLATHLAHQARAAEKDPGKFQKPIAPGILPAELIRLREAVIQPEAAAVVKPLGREPATPAHDRAAVVKGEAATEPSSQDLPATSRPETIRSRKRRRAGARN